MVDISPIFYEHQALINKLEILAIIGKNYLATLENRSKIEAIYAKKLKIHTTTPLKIGRFDNTTTIDLMETKMGTIFKEINTQGDFVSDVHQETSERLMMAKNELENFLKTYEAEKKRLVLEIEKKVQDHQNSVRLFEKQKASFSKINLELKGVNNELDDALLNNTQSVDKLVQKKQLTIEKLQKAKEAYAESVQKTNSCAETIFLHEMPIIITSVLGLIKQFYERFAKSLNTIIIGIESLSPVVAKEANILKIELDEMIFETDLNEFTQKVKSDNEIPPIQLEIDDSIQFITTIEEEESTNENIPKETKKLKDNPNQIFKSDSDDVEDVFKMIKQQEGIQDSPRPKTPEEFNAEIVDGELIDLS